MTEVTSITPHPRQNIYNALGSLFYFAVSSVTLFSTAFPRNEIFELTLSLTALILLLYVVAHYKILDLFDGLLLLFAFLICILTVVHGVLSLGIITACILLAAFPIFLRTELKKSTRILDVLYILCAIVIMINFITLFMPSIGVDGLDRYFLGGKNALATSLVPAVLIVLIHSFLHQKKITKKAFALSSLAVIAILIGGSSTGAIAALFILAYIVFLYRYTFKRLFVLIMFPIIQISFYNTAFIVSVPSVANFITDTLNKSLTFTNRTDVWQVAMDAIIQSPIVGYGRGNSIISTSFSGLSETHNMTLEILLTGGVVLFGLFLIIVCYAFRKTKIKKSKTELKIYSTIIFFFFTYLILGLMESVSFRIGLWTILALIPTTAYIVARKRLANE